MFNNIKRTVNFYSIDAIHAEFLINSALSASETVILKSLFPYKTNSSFYI